MLLILLIVILLAILLYDQPSPVPKVLVSNNSELLRHFTAPPFQRLGLALLVANSGAEARALFDAQEPPLVVLDAEADGIPTAKARSRSKARPCGRCRATGAPWSASRSPRPLMPRSTCSRSSRCGRSS